MVESSAVQLSRLPIRLRIMTSPIMQAAPPGLSTVHQVMALVNAATPLKTLLGVTILCRNPPYLMAIA